MIKNHLKVALRYLARHKGYAFINTFGLAVGIACCILIMLFVRSEWSFDRFHSKASRIHRAWLQEVYEGKTFTNTVTPLPMGPTLQANIPDIESTCRVFTFNSLIKHGGNTFNEPVHLVDSNFFQVFDFSLEQTNGRTPFVNSSSIILTPEVSKKYFGEENAIGKNLELQLGDNKVLFTVTAIAGEAPLESSIRYGMLIPFSNDVHLFSEGARLRAWQQVFAETYIVLKPGTTANGTESKFDALVKQIAGENYKPGEYNIHLQPLTDIHLNKDLPAGIEPVSDPKYSYILGTIGILVLLIACVNFITLSIGRSTTRALEVGVRKVLGAERQQLVRQFWGEALILTLAAAFIGIGMAALLLSPFNQLANRELFFSPDSFTILFCAGLVSLIALVAGFYPSIVLSGFAPVRVLKGSLQAGSRIGFFRKALIVGQFVASIMMIIGTLMIGRQLEYLQNKNLGYNKERIVVIPTNKPRRDGFPLAERFKQALSKNPQVVSSTISLYSFAEPGWINLGYEDDKSIYRDFRMNAIDVDFLTSMQLELSKGRNFEEGNSADLLNSMIVNEALVREYGWKDPIGMKLPGSYEQQVVGVVKDFHFESLHTDIKPLALVLRPDSMFRRSNDVSFGTAAQPRISVRLRPGDLQQQVASLRDAWKATAGDQDFEFRFLDESLNAAYIQEIRLGKIVRAASVLSIFIACMGLFGLATLVVVRRTKEIGIRKVLGANVGSIVTLLSKDFVILVFVSSLIAFPVAWFGLQKWMEDFAYRINISWVIFLGAAAIALFVALLTVCIQAIKAALMNPVKSLRTE